MAPGARRYFGASIFEFEVSIGSKCIVLKQVLVTLLGLFGAPRSHSVPPVVILRPGNCAPFPPRLYASVKYIYFVLVKDGILHEILIYINVYIFKLGMPPSHP